MHADSPFLAEADSGSSLRSLPAGAVETTKDPPPPPLCSSRDLILAPEAAGGLSPIILAHTDAEERFNGHWSAYPLLGA